MEKWKPTAYLKIVSGNLEPHLCAKKSGFLFQCLDQIHHQDRQNNNPGFSNHLARFFLQNPSLQRVFHRMPVEGGVI